MTNKRQFIEFYFKRSPFSNKHVNKMGLSGSNTPDDKDIEMQQLMAPEKIKEDQETKNSEPLWKQTVLEFLFCFVGLQCSYITWGLMQELIMTTQFEATEHVENGMFPSATFCVLSNRAIAIAVGFCICYYKHGRISSPVAPTYVLIPCALSNTVSSFCQYASLSYVDFPLQNLFKSTKVIPVMLMGKFLKGTIYPWVQYGEAALISVGVVIFSQANSIMGSEEPEDNMTGSDESDASMMRTYGLGLLCGYVMFDSFTSQWQSKVYSDYGKIDQYHMMFGVNFWAIIMTIIALIGTDEIHLVIEFLSVNPTALWYNIVTGICSTTGQLFIYYTIKRFGPVALTIIMTTRQMFSICVSAFMFSHHIPAVGIVGVLIVFGTVFYSINRQYKAKMAKDAEMAASRN